MPPRALLLVLGCVAFGAAIASAREPAARVVLIGGVKSEGPARHSYSTAVGLLKALLESSPDASAAGISVEAFPHGWPDDPTRLAGATLVWCFDGLDRHPLRDAARRKAFEAMMASGTGLVALHQSFTVTEDDDALDLARWLGAARFGMPDRVTERISLVPAAPAHPVSRGLAATRYHDELYPTVRFAEGARPTIVAEAAAASGTFPAAWAFERPGGGRSFAYSGTHFLLALDEPVVRRMILNAIFWTARVEVPEGGVRTGLADAAMRATREELAAAPAPPVPDGMDTLSFHRDAQRLGWNAAEKALTPASVASTAFGPLWESQPLDALDGEAPRLYASPLYIDRVALRDGRARSVVFAASSLGFVYAINAKEAGGDKPGAILWRTRLGSPCRLAPRMLDGVSTGVLATPVIDVDRKRLYITSCEAGRSWQAYALDIGSGEVASGWPVALDETAFEAVNRNRGTKPAPRREHDYRLQRGALALSPDGSILYVTFGESATGWLVAVDTRRARIASAFATVANPHRSSGGLWGPGGAAVDAKGRVFVVTGTNFASFVDQPHDWNQSALMLEYSPAGGLALRGTYTPFNHCETAVYDIDLGSGGALLLPDLDSAASATPRLMAFGGKQGNAYLVDRDRMPGRLDHRPACTRDAASDGSLLAPRSQPQFGTRGPLNVFGPYSERDGAMIVARARSVPAYFRDADGEAFLFMTGNTRREEGAAAAVPPSLARLKVVATPGEPAYLEVDGVERTLVFENPGSPVVTSNGHRDAIVWVLDENATRTALLSGEDAPRPVMYAFEAATLRLLWRSAPGALRTSGKYNEPAIARGVVFVGTDRIQAFGLRQ